MLKFTKSLIASVVVFTAATQMPVIAEWENIDNVELNAGRQVFDRTNRQFNSTVSIKNNSGEDFIGPLRLLVSDSSMVLANPDGSNEEGVPYVVIPEGLGAGESARLQLSFELQRARLRFNLALQQEAEEESDWELVWSDEFDGDQVDETKWSFEENCWGGGNNEQQCYTNRLDNSVVADGLLTIIAKREDFTGPNNPNGDTNNLATLPYTSARLRTINKGDWTYGRFEISAKMPQGQGTWPAIWMLPTDYVYGGWAASGEIDIMEAVNLKAQSDASGAQEGDEENRIHGTLHYGRSWPGNVASGTDFSLPNGINPADGFHEYAIEWEDGEIRWYIDDIHYATQTSDGWYAQYVDEDGVLRDAEGSAPFNERFHMLINLAVGGNWAANVNETGIDESVFPQTMQVDYVRVYECSINPSNGQGCATIGENPEFVPGNTPPVLQDPDSDIGAGPVFDIFIDDLSDGLGFDGFNPDGTVVYNVTSEDGRGNVISLSQSGNVGNFFVNGSPGMDLSHFAEYGEISFDIKVVENNSDATALIKMDSGWPSVSDIRIELPSVGEWQTVTLKVADILANSNTFAPGNFADVAQIVNPFVFEPSGPVELMLDNIKYQYNLAGINEVVVFDEFDHPPYTLGQFVANGSVTMEQIDSGDSAQGQVKELTFNTNESVVFFQTQVDGTGATLKLDMTHLDTLEFDLYLVEDPRDLRNFTIKMDCGFPCGTGDVPIEAPPVGVWTSYSIPLADLVSHPGSNLDLASVDTPLVIFPSWGNQQGVVMQVDNVRVVGDGDDNNNVPIEVVVAEATTIFDDDLASEWSFFDCCGNAAVSFDTDGQRGQVIKVDFFGPSGTVSGLQASLPHNLNAVSQGTISFDLKLVSPSNFANAAYLVKFEGSDGSFYERELSASLEGMQPELGQWQTYTFNIADLAAGGLNIEKLRLIMAFPSWMNAQGAIYQLDNVVITP
jgi:beta-glucanase (GH16 family)